MDIHTTQTTFKEDKDRNLSKHQKMLETFMREDSEEYVAELRKKFKEAGLKE